MVRGSRNRLKGLEALGGHVELRFPIYRDFLRKPFERVGLGEGLILKDLRGFGFGDLGTLETDVGSFRANSWAYSAGVGLRLDLSFMLWPVVTGRVPVRLAGWSAGSRSPPRPTRASSGAASSRASKAGTRASPSGTATPAVV